MAKSRQKIDASQVEELALIGLHAVRDGDIFKLQRSRARPVALAKNHQKGAGGVVHDFF